MILEWKSSATKGFTKFTIVKLLEGILLLKNTSLYGMEVELLILIQYTKSNAEN